MAVTAPWLRKKREQSEDFDPREHNTEEENDLLAHAEERFVLAENGKTDPSGRPLHAKWRDMDKMYRGNQWKSSTPAYRSQPVINLTFAFVEAVVPRITDNNPSILVLPRQSRKDQRLADYLQDIQSYLWYSNEFQYELGIAARMVLKYGTVIFKAVWDPDLFDELGDVRYTVLHPMNFFPDPRAETIDQMEYCFTRIPKPLEYFARRWPDKGHLVRHAHDLDATENTEGANTYVGEESAALHEYWFRDENGDQCVMYYANGVVLQIIGGEYDDSNEPVYRHNKFPFTRWINYPIDKHFWGMGEIEIVEIIQRLINSFEAQIIDNTRLMGNAMWVVSKRISGLTEEDAWLFVDRPGHIIFTDEGGVERVQGESIPPHIPQHVTFLIQLMEQILGVHDVVQGRRPSGVRAASAIIALQETANIRIRQKVRHMQQALIRLVQQGNALVLEHYNEPRNVRMTGRHEITTLDVREALEERLLDQAAAAQLLEGRAPEEITEDDMEQIIREIKFPAFDVEVNIGPSVPYSQALLYEQAKEYFGLGAIDQQALLEHTNFPGAEEIINRMQGGMAAEQEMKERVGEATYRQQQGGMPAGSDMSMPRGGGR